MANKRSFSLLKYFIYDKMSVSQFDIKKGL